MISLAQLSKQLSEPSKPFNSWQPTHCGELPIVIDEQGQWFYDGSEITRIAMVKLFASVLCKEGTQFYLKTPVEKIAIEVQDAPFIIVDWRFENTAQGKVLCCIDNIARQWLISADQPLAIQNYKGIAVPYLQLPYGCCARINRSVFYQWAEIAAVDKRGYYIKSAGEKFYLS
ncbi:DUF1285 domain-containing protein [Pseudoalteromonas sp. S3178]|uniref:DUF1285 domain-containing protein n=1 Tax=Pseudoalteromonas sp. S3178 TaxID=579532 RepID=UPI00110A2974|nr:DUF1285 domain-containing protein [Pseudoalteromonas sp. S3178]TMP05676.1 DUF1285 domain-containing protein [Pseudoalteromonas sp. S3178]